MELKFTVNITVGIINQTNAIQKNHSGLDSASAYSTMLLLRKLANCGKTVMTCIHQPSSEILATIDRILILAQGKVVYEGKLKPDLYEYLKKHNRPCPNFTNIGDYIIQQINKNPQYFIAKWESHTTNHKLPNMQSFSKQKSTATEMNEINPPKMSPITAQIFILVKRQFGIFLRNRRATRMRLFQLIFVSLLMGLIWFQLTPVSDEQFIHVQTNMQNRFGALFLATSYLAMNAIGASNQVFPSQRLVFEKERVSNWYYTFPWILAKFCVDIPWTIIVIIPFALISKYMINLRINIFWYYFILILIVLSSDSLGFCIGCMASNHKTAAQLMPLIIAPLMLFSGFFISIQSIPAWLRWIRWIDVYYYGVEILCIAEFEDLHNDAIDVGNMFLEQYAMQVENKWRDIYCLMILFCSFRILSIIYLIIKNGK